MDRSLKERLIGASVLVGLAVWLIPWVLDGPLPDTEFEPAQVPAAERSLPLRTQTIRLDTPQDTSMQADAADIPGIPVTVGSQPATQAPRALDTGRDPAATAVPASEGAASAAAAGSASEVVIAESVEGSSDASGERAAQVPDRTSPAATARHPGPGWLVQVGSFGEEENARRQADRVEALGYTANLYTHTAGGRVMYRVRVGPEPSRESAEDIVLSLTAHGFVAQVVSSD